MAAAEIVTGQKTQINIDPTSTIQKITLTPAPVTNAADAATVSALATDAAGQTVLTDPKNWRWTLADPSVAQIVSDGAQASLRASRPGNVTITAMETESGKSGETTLLIVQRPTGG